MAAVHDLHVWTVTSGLISLSAHVEVSPACDWHAALPKISRLLQERFGIAHVTLQPEEPHLLPDAFRGCLLDGREGPVAYRVPAPVGARNSPTRYH